MHYLAASRHFSLQYIQWYICCGLLGFYLWITDILLSSILLEIYIQFTNNVLTSISNELFGVAS